MLDLQDKFVDIEPSDFIERGVPKFDDVLGVFTLLNKNLLGESLDMLVTYGALDSNSFDFNLQKPGIYYRFDQFIESNKRTSIGF